MNKFAVSIGLIAFWVVLPVFLALLNISDYQELHTNDYSYLTGDDFNLFSLTGFARAIDFIFGLGKYSISNVHWMIKIFFVLLFFISLITGFYFARG